MPIRLPISIKNSINTNIEDKINDVNLTAKKHRRDVIPPISHCENNKVAGYPNVNGSEFISYRHRRLHTALELYF